MLRWMQCIHDKTAKTVFKFYTTRRKFKEKENTESTESQP